MSNEANSKSSLNHVNDAEQRGAKVLTGGGPREQS